MAATPLVDLEADQEDGNISHSIQTKMKSTYEYLTATTDLTGTSLIPGLHIKVVVRGRSSSHDAGLSVGFDNINNIFIISQHPKIPDSGTYLRLSISLKYIKITDNHERAITTGNAGRTNISSLFIKTSAAFMRDIIHTSQDRVQQSHDISLIDLMCSLSDVELLEGAVLEISEICRDIWGENNQLNRLVNHLSRGEGGEKPPGDSMEGTTESEANASIKDIWQGLETLGMDRQPSTSQNTFDLTAPGPWCKPEITKPQSTYNYNKNRDCSHNNGDIRKPAESQQPCDTCIVQADDQHEHHTCEISSMPQLSDNNLGEYPPLDARIISSTDSQSNQSSGDQYLSINSPEGQVVEESLKGLERNSRLFWESQGDKEGCQQYREPKTKFGEHQNMYRSHAGAAECDQAAISHALSDHVQSNLSATEWESRNELLSGGSVQTAAAEARGRGRAGARVGRRGRAAARRSTCSTAKYSYEPFTPAHDKLQGPPKACYNDRTPFGGWDRVKASRGKQPEQPYVGESSMSLQRGAN